MPGRLLVALTFLAALLVPSSAAQAVVVDMSQIGQTSVPYNSADRGNYSGVALVPGTLGSLATAKIPTVTSSAPCVDPALSVDLGGPTLPNNGLCSHGGGVIHANETFDLSWDPLRRDWATTRYYLEQFLRDVADGSGTLTSPFALTTQYTDAAGRAANASRYGGGCIDYGNPGGFTCQFGNTTGSGTGNSYPASGCPVTGTNQFVEALNGSFTDAPNDVCLTDAQIQGELTTILGQEGLVGRTQPSYTPLVVLMTPPGVETCLDATGVLCSANGKTTAPAVPTVSTAALGGHTPAGAYSVEVAYVTAGGESLASGPASVTTTGTTSTITISSPQPVAGVTGWYAYVSQAGGKTYTRQQAGGSPSQIGTDLTLTNPPTSTGALPNTSTAPSFCSYHSQVDVGGTEVAYVVLPWVAWWDSSTDCTDPGAPAIPTIGTPEALATAAGAQLVSPLSQAQIPAIVDPNLNGWFALDGTEMNDHGCIPFAGGLDTATVAGTSYFLQREFNNGGVIQTDPNAPSCASGVALASKFVVPSAVDQGDVVEFDASKTVSTLLVPSASYVWSFGDGATAVGPSVAHTYATGGTYAVKLTVTDRGGNQSSLTQPITVLGPNGEVVPPPLPPTPPPPAPPTLHVHLLLMPQSLQSALRSGIAIRISSSEAADGFAQISIPRSAAKRAHIKTGRGPSVVIARGTVAGLSSGGATLHLHLSRSIATQLKRLKHVTMTIRFTLTSVTGHRLSVDAAAHY